VVAVTVVSDWVAKPKSSPRRVTEREKATDLVVVLGWRRLFFFGLFITRMRPMEIMARLCTARFLSAVRAVAAHCKHPFALRPGLPQKMCRAPKKLQRKRSDREETGKRKEHMKLPNPLLRPP